MQDIKITDVRVIPGDSGFLVDDGESAILYDSGFGFTGPQLVETIQKQLGSRSLDYIFLTHSHYDHVLGSAHVLRAYPEAKVVAGEYAVQVFGRPGAKATMRDLDGKRASAMGVQVYEDLADDLRVDIAVSEGDRIRAGKLEFVTVELPGHTRCSVGFLEPALGLLLGTETLGVYSADADVVPACLVGYEMTLRSLEKAGELTPRAILAPHYGLLEGERASCYLKRGKQRAVEVAEMVRNALRNGKSKTQIAAEYMRETGSGLGQVYPTDAMALNTRIMIDMLEKELLCE